MFGKRENESYQKLNACNLELKNRVASLSSKIGTLQQQMKTNKNAQAVYSNYDVIEMHMEMLDLAQNNSSEFDPSPLVLQAVDSHECPNEDMEDISARIEDIVFSREKSKLIE